MRRTKKHHPQATIRAKKRAPDSNHNVKALGKDDSMGASQLAGRGAQPRQTVATVISNQNYPPGNKLPPDFLGTAAYLLMADKMSLGPELLEAAGLGAISFQEHMASRDGLERLAVGQALVAHARLMWLSTLLTEQTNTKAITTISASIDSALSTFVRLMRALDEYQRPRAANTTVSIGQANVAGNQLVQHIQNREVTPKHGDQTRIARKQASIITEVIPANTKRVALAQNGHQTDTALEKEHGTAKPRRKGSRSAERT